MKRLKILTFAIAILSITACINGQMRKTVWGDKKIVTKERKTEPFTGIKVSTGIDVFLKQGNNEAVSVEADENLHEYILTEVRDGVLNVYTDANIRSAERKRVYVTMKEVKSIRTTSAGDVIGEAPLKSDKLELSASSAGNIKLEVFAKEINLDISSSGDITLAGEADILEADLSSAGDLNAYDLKVREADVSASSAGDADINVSEKITARASSAGDINYQGNPKYVDANSSSAGGIHKR
ncbi:MAG: head GIN domain-containing protein [Bacteroidota bacterium]